VNSPDEQEPRSAQISGPAPQKCFICGDPVGEHWLCKTHGKEGGPITLCCYDCMLQYLDSLPPPDACEQEIRAYDKRTQFFIGEDKPWL